MIISVLGNVDSGKSTFVKAFSDLKTQEKYGRTQTLKFLEGYIGAIPIRFIDVPGHSLLGHNISTAVQLADLVVYLVDANNPKFQNLQKILKKPTIVLLNKYHEGSLKSEKESLKQICEDSRYQLKLYSQIANFFQNYFTQDKQIVPFLDFKELKTQTPVFPISLSTKFGVNQFITFFNKLIAPQIEIENCCYACLTKETPSKRYTITKFSPKESYHFKIQNQVYPLETIFDYNVVSREYILKPAYTELPKALVFKGYPKSQVEVELDSQIEVQDLELKNESASLKFLNILKEFQDPEFKLVCLDSSPNVKSSILNVFQGYESRLEFTAGLTIKNFIALHPKESTLRICWGNQEHVNFQENIIVSDSFFKLLQYIETYFEKRKNSKLAHLETILNSLATIRLEKKFLFKEDAKVIICGGSLIRGTLKKGDLLYSDQVILGEVDSIEYNGKSLDCWKDCKLQCAVKIQKKNPWISSDLGELKFKNFDLDKILEKFKEVEIDYFKEKIKEIKDEGNSS